MKTSGSMARLGSGILAGLALLLLTTAVGCGSSPPELSAAEEELTAVDVPVAEEPTEPELPVESAEEPVPELPDLPELTELTELDPDVLITDAEEVLNTARKALKDIERGVTNKTSEEDLYRTVDAAIEELQGLHSADDVEFEETRQAWDLKLKLEYQGTQRRWKGFTDRLAASRDLLWGSEFTKEAEYANGLLLKLRWFGPDIPVWQAVEKLTEHAVAFPMGATPVRMFLSYATELTKRRDYTNAKSICRIALFNMKDHPDERSIEQYLGKLESPNSRNVRVTMRDNVPQIKRRKDRLQKQLERETKQMQSMVPLQIDPITRLDKVTAGWHSIQYSYTVTGATREVLKKRAAIQKRVSSQLRTTFATQLLLDDGVQFNYRYFDTKGSLLFRFSVSK
jgi:hypothetical protein